MNKPVGYDEAPAVEIGEFEKLELGGHVCVIIKAENIKTKSGKEALKLYLDIADGDQKGFFMRQYNSDTRANKKWGCTYLQLSEGNSLQYFKGLISAIEKSNPQYQWNWNEKTLLGKLIGGVFGRVQYKKANGELSWFTKCKNIRSIEAIVNGVDIPEDEYLDEDKDIFQPLADEEFPF